MQFGVLRDQLLRPLARVANVVDRKNTMPILGNVLLVNKDGVLKLTATDMEIEVSCATPITSEQEGEITVPARKFADIVRALPEGAELHCQIDKERLKVSAGRSKFNLATLSAFDYPNVDVGEMANAIELPAAKLLELLKRCSFAMAVSDMRYFLNGMLLEIRPGMLRAVATDGHRLATADTAVEHAYTDIKQIIVPRKAIVELEGLLAGSEQNLTLRFGRNHVQVEHGSDRFISKLIDGRYPDYTAVVPAPSENTLTVNREAARAALTRVAILSSEKYRGVKVEFKAEGIEFSAHNPEQEEAVELVQVDGRMPQYSVGFNIVYLNDALAAFGEAELTWSMRDAASSLLITRVGDLNCRQVVMPMRL
jgi:DNA polymerase III subunit beta